MIDYITYTLMAILAFLHIIDSLAKMGRTYKAVQEDTSSDQVDYNITTENKNQCLLINTRHFA